MASQTAKEKWLNMCRRSLEWENSRNQVLTESLNLTDGTLHLILLVLWCPVLSVNQRTESRVTHILGTEIETADEDKHNLTFSPCCATPHLIGQQHYSNSCSVLFALCRDTIFSSISFFSRNGRRWMRFCFPYYTDAPQSRFYCNN